MRYISTMHAYVEIIGSGCHDASPSIQLFFEDGRYLFECGDGTQRVCTEYGTKLSKLRGVFLTSLSAPSIGGLFGLLLTLADGGKQRISITAPHGLKELFRNAKHFCNRPQLMLNLQEASVEASAKDLPLTLLKDENVTIQAVPVKARRDLNIDTSFGSHYDALAYICRLRDLRGRFNPKRAIDLGVEKGRKFGLLQKGQSVTTNDGRVVSPAEVMAPSTPGPVVVVISCPTADHVHSIISSIHLNPVNLGVRYDGVSKQAQSRSCVIIHIAPLEVLKTPSYTEWCDSFGEGACHIPLHSSVSSRQTVFTSQAEDISLLHSMVDKELFPLPMDAYAPGTASSVEEAREQSRNQVVPSSVPALYQQTQTKGSADRLSSERLGRWVNAECKTKYILSPPSQVGLDNSAVRPRFILRNDGIPAKEWRSVSPSYASEPLPGGTEMKTPLHIASLQPGTTAVRFLGTGAAIPGKHRNVSSILIDMYERGGVMLDCGEGTWGQMVRHLGSERASQVLCRLKLVFISHMHADHHLGLLRILHERTVAVKMNDEFKDAFPLVIVGPDYLQVWLEAFQMAAKVPLRDKIAPGLRSYSYYRAASLTDPKALDARFFSDSFGIEIGCVRVTHCPDSYGVILQDCVNEWKIVYSGDTRPCEDLARAGMDATLAIHEATLEDEMLNEARAKMHSTTSEALEICANKMRAWRTILTHFSQRYPKIPKLDAESMKKLYNGRAAIAFDLMCVDLTRLEDLPRIVPAVKAAFPDATYDDDDTYKLDEVR